jgi:hypothetical protein
VGCPFERAVAGHRRDREEIDSRVRGGEQDRDHVVAGIAVQDPWELWPRDDSLLIHEPKQPEDEDGRNE